MVKSLPLSLYLATLLYNLDRSVKPTAITTAYVYHYSIVRSIGRCTRGRARAQMTFRQQLASVILKQYVERHWCEESKTFTEPIPGPQVQVKTVEFDSY